LFCLPKMSRQELFHLLRRINPTSHCRKWEGDCAASMTFMDMTFLKLLNFLRPSVWDVQSYLPLTD
jgi:hypothetical protein